MNDQQLEEIFNRTFAGLTFYFRDAELPASLAARYVPGQVIVERGFTDCSRRGGGLSTSFRYLIASASAREMPAFSADTAGWGHVLLPAGSHFKVLDVYQVAGKTQVLLLHIPNDTVDVFATIRTSVEEEVVQAGRKSFDAKLEAPPVAELESADWRARTADPLGMTAAGDLFPVEKGAAPAASHATPSFWRRLFGRG